MKIKAARILSYKSFDDSGWIELGENFTVLVGQNSSGKSAFLQALELKKRYITVPHKSGTRDVPLIYPNSVLMLRIEIQNGELEKLAKYYGSFSININSSIDPNEELRKYFDRSHTVEVEYRDVGFSLISDPAFGIAPQDVTYAAIFVGDNRSGELEWNGLFNNCNHGNTLTEIVRAWLDSNSFIFNSERYKVGRNPMYGQSIMNSDGSNLPNVLFDINKDILKHNEFQSVVREILPDIKGVVVAPVGGSTEIEVYIHNHTTQRVDLAMPLNDCGTGVAQILCIIYVILFYNSAIISIDEPNSFLHPRALRRLLDVCKRYDRHQYIMSTHTPDVISVLKPEKLLLFQWNEHESQSVISSSSGNDVKHISDVLADIGASYADTFGYDIVCFVEGPTEKVCFPLFFPSGASGVNFVPMREASGLTSKKPQRLFEIYKNGVEGSALLPPRVIFSFDKDGKTEKVIEDLKRASKGAAYFIPGVMYESHLLHPEAIASLLADIDDSGKLYDVKNVAQWLSENWSRFPVSGLAHTYESCDAANLLKSLFEDLAGAGFEYNKIEHGRKLTEWILENDPSHFKDLKAYLEILLATPSNHAA